MKADLHMHSDYSDGLYSPESVAQKAFTAGCEVAALTDHDTLGGAARFAAEGKRLGMRTVCGIEISTYGEACETHILGYGFWLSDNFTAYVKALEHSRAQRGEQILQKLKKLNRPIPDGYFIDKARGGLSRAHIARALVELGYESDYKSAFGLLKEGAPAYVALDTRSPREAIEQILSAGGMPVLAHPSRMKIGGLDLFDYVKRLKDFGLTAVEAVYRDDPPATAARLKRVCAKLGLLVTCGGDFHGEPGRIHPRELPAATAAALRYND